jgi:hypothetical protein
MTENVEKIRELIRKDRRWTIHSSQAPLGSVMEFARRSEERSWTCATLLHSLFPDSWQMIKSSGV